MVKEGLNISLSKVGQQEGQPYVSPLYKLLSIDQSLFMSFLT